jgi:ammonia channel protein AmtB
VWSGFNPGVSFTASYFAHSIVLNATTAPVPVPAALWMFGTGLIGLTGLARKRKEA